MQQPAFYPSPSSSSAAYDEMHCVEETFLVSLNSQDVTVKLNLDDPAKLSHVLFEFDPPVLQYDDKTIHTTCSVHQFTAFNVVYVVNSSNNKLKILFADSGLSITQTIPVGNHNSITLMDWFNNTASFGTSDKLTLSHDYLTQLFSIKSSIDEIFSIVTAESTCQTLLGFTTDSDAVSDSLGALTLPYPGVLLGERNLFIHWENSPARNVSSSKMGRSNFIACIGIDPLSPAISYQGGESFQLYGNAVESFELEFRDAKGNLIDFRNSNWTLVLKFSVLRETAKRKMSFWEAVGMAASRIDNSEY